MLPELNGRWGWRSFIRRLVPALAASMLLTVVLVALGVPRIPGRALSLGLAFTIMFAPVLPRETPHRWRKHSLVWSAHLVGSTTWFALTDLWFG